MKKKDLALTAFVLSLSVQSAIAMEPQEPIETQTIPVQQKTEETPVKAGVKRPPPLVLDEVKKSTIVISSPKSASPTEQGSPKSEQKSPKSEPLKRASKTLPSKRGSASPRKRSSSSLPDTSQQKFSQGSSPESRFIKINLSPRDESPQRDKSPRRDKSLSPKSQDREPSPAPQRLEGGGSPKSSSGDRECAPERGRERDSRIHDESPKMNPEGKGSQSPGGNTRRTSKSSSPEWQYSYVGQLTMSSSGMPNNNSPQGSHKFKYSEEDQIEWKAIQEEMRKKKQSNTSESSPDEDLSKDLYAFVSSSDEKFEYHANDGKVYTPENVPPIEDGALEKLCNDLMKGIPSESKGD